MRKDIGDADAFCSLLESLLREYEIKFDAMRIVEAAVARLRADIVEGSTFCARIAKFVAKSPCSTLVGRSMVTSGSATEGR